MNKLRFVLVALLLAVAGITLTACDNTATPTSMCAFVVNDGQNGDNSQIDHIAYPGSTIDTQNKNVYYFPCNARNYIVNDGKQVDASGKQIGDRFIPSVGYTKEGTKVKVFYTMYWTLNQDPKVLKNDFYPFCYKYTCYSTDSSSGNANFSTPGWNGMLAENFPQASDRLVLKDTPATLTDDSWKKHDTAQWDALAKQLSDQFAAAVRANTGVADDMFCGSGNSGWSDPSNPGKGTFTCSNVRFVVTGVSNFDDAQQNAVDTQSNANIQQLQNERLLNAAKAKYGNDAGYWLGLQDTIAACKSAASANCVIVIGGNSAPSITVPQK